MDYYYYGFSEVDLNEIMMVGKYVFGKDMMKFFDFVKVLKEIYFGIIGFEFMYV